MQHDIIDNRERKLAASVKPLLSESERAKFAVGYFFISGFKFVAIFADFLRRSANLKPGSSQRPTAQSPRCSTSEPAPHCPTPQATG
jgi:hypothetical protein